MRGSSVYARNKEKIRISEKRKKSIGKKAKTEMNYTQKKCRGRRHSEEKDSRGSSVWDFELVETATKKVAGTAMTIRK